MQNRFVPAHARHGVGWTKIVAMVVVALVMARQADAQEDHSHGLHFSHPLFTESVSPDTKVRFNTHREWETDGRAWEHEFEAEYAFHRAFSIEVGIPYVVRQPDGTPSSSRVGNMELLFKFANYAFESKGLLLGYGVEFGIPTGNQAVGIGSDHIWSVAPVFNIGYMQGKLELVGFSILEIPFGQNAGEEIETEWLYNASALVHVSPQFQALFELNGETVLSGDESGATLVRASPGVKVAPSTRIPLFVGLGVSVPLQESELDAMALVSLFYHF